MYDQTTELLLNHFKVDLNADLETSPISLTEMIKKCGIKIKHDEYEKDVSGIYIRSKKGNYIFINQIHPYVRRRFSLGHEFGHAMLNHPQHVSSLIEKAASSAIRRIEYEANQFSACILMPRDLIQIFARRGLDIPSVANWFRVSWIAAAIRFYTLGLRTDEAEGLISDYRMQQGDATYEDDFSQVEVAAAKNVWNLR